MNKLILAGAIIALFAACNNNTSTTSDNAGDTATIAQGDTAIIAQVDTANAPVISFEKVAYDFGKVTDGEKVSYEFKFKNTGKSPLIITKAVATCGCTVPDYPHNPIAPGENGAISVVFDSSGKTGMQDKTITLTSNAVPATTQLHLTGEVKQVKSK